MTCAETLEAIAAAPERGAPIPAEAALHLESCADCRRESGEIRRLLDAIGDLEPPDPGEGYWRSFGPRLRLRLDAGRRRAPAVAGPRRTAPGLAWMAAAAAMVLAASLAIVRQGSIAPDGGDGVDSLVARIDARYLAAGDEERLDLQEVLATLDAGTAEEPARSLGEVADDGTLDTDLLTSLLSPADTGLIPRLNDLLEDLPAEERSEFLEGLVPGEEDPASAPEVEPS